ncbi:MAG: glycosyltransferase family 9 protein [Pyrinomonadaceae bacterium]|nr:glycosyltransferase family 9 protein [Pyrinomonadaceae bacterium]
MRKKINWHEVRKVLVVRLRSIGDTVLTTPSLISLKKFLPDAQIDILVEDWVAPVLDNFDSVGRVLSVTKDPNDRISLARKIRKEKYDVAFNLHGGTTSTFFVRVSGARHRVGYQDYQFSFLYNHLLSSASEFWGKDKTHSAEQQMALLGFVGVPVDDLPKTRLVVTEGELESLAEKITAEAQRRGEDFSGLLNNFALLHPVAAFETKQWATENFASVAEFLNERNLKVIAIATKKERDVLARLEELSKGSILTVDNLKLPEITALASKADLFVGNDSGIAHIAAAVGTPSVVIFGSSNRDHWHPWTDAPNEIVYEEFPCQPCAGYVCEEFGEPQCIISVKSENVIAAVKKLT